MHSPKVVRLAVKARLWSPTQVDWSLAAQCVQREEKDRIGKFIFKRDAKMAMVGRLLMRYAVAKCLDVPMRCLSFGRTNKGKPYLQSTVDKSTPRCDMNFNVSHSGDYVVFAADRERLIGVDVMKVEWPRSKPVGEFFSNMKRQLTQHEWAEVNKRSGDLEQLKTFYRLWCLKESLVKALGTGIGFEVGRLEFHFHTAELANNRVVTDTHVKIDGAPSQAWSFQETMLDGDHCVAVALHGDAGKEKTSDSDPNSNLPSFTTLEVGELLSQCEPLEGSVVDMEYWEQFNLRQEDPQSDR